MLKKDNLGPYGPWRVLSLRSGQISIQNPCALALPTQFWFTPEAIVLDALHVLDDLLWLWRFFRRAVSIYALRVLIILSLIALISLSYRSPDLSAATSAPERLVENTNQIQITTQIIARESLDFSWPVSKTYISSFFSSFHQGIDIPNQYGSPVKPLSKGKVSFAGWDTGGWGKTVVIEHFAGYSSRYCHLSTLDAQTGQEVGRETIIGRVGTTGVATGPHLHFEVYKDGRAINPLTILP